MKFESAIRFVCKYITNLSRECEMVNESLQLNVTIGAILLANSMRTQFETKSDPFIKFLIYLFTSLSASLGQ